MRHSRGVHLLITSLVSFFFVLGEPVFASDGAYWGMEGGAAPAMLSFSTYGGAFLGIWIVEAIVFKRLLDITWTRAIFGSLLLNLFSTAAGAFVAIVAFTMPLLTWISLGLFLILTYRIYFNIGKIPEFYGPILLVSFVIGSIAAYNINGLVPPLSPFVVGLMVILSMVTSYGLSVGLEALFCGKLLGKNSWKAVVRANAISFIILVILIPYFSNNIYYDNQDVIEEKVVQMVKAGAAEDDVVNILRHYAAPTPFTLGVSKDNIPVDSYYSSLEEDIIISLYTGELDQVADPKYGLAIAENAVSYPHLFDESRENMEWAKEYFDGWTGVLYHKDEGPLSPDYIGASITWTTWYQITDVSNDFDELPEPNEILKFLNSE